MAGQAGGGTRPLTPDPDHTWLVECFAPGIDDVAVAAAADRVRALLARRDAGDAAIDYLGALLMAEDEVVFHAFRAADVEVVRAVSAAAGLEFERVVESIGVLPGNAPDDELAENLIRAPRSRAISAGTRRVYPVEPEPELRLTAPAEKWEGEHS